jgi:RNA polymerase sigma factor (sigma-70 family)
MQHFFCFLTCDVLPSSANHNSYQRSSRNFTIQRPKTMTPSALEEQFITMLRAHKKLIYKVCHSYTTNKEDFKDLEQEITIQLWKALPKYDAGYKLTTWMYRIALNTAISFYRKEKRKPHHSLLDGQILEMLADTERERDAELEHQIQMLHAFIEKLGEVNKALMLLYLEDNSYKEMAEILGISESNVATKISRIKVLLKKQFSNHI